MPKKSSAAVVADPPPATPLKVLSGQLQLVPLDLIDESPTNPRKHFDEAKVAELAASIREKGVLQPIVVRPRQTGRFELVCGARRLRATRLAGLDYIPASVQELTDAAVLEVQLVENSQRADVSPLEESEAIVLLRERYNRTKSEIATQLGRTPAWVETRLTLGRLPDAFKALLEERVIDLGGALILARVPAERVEATVDGLRESFSRHGRTVPRSWVAHRMADLVHELEGAPFDVADASLLPKSGACGSCTKRSGVQATLFGAPDDEEDRCLDAECWTEKTDITWERAVADAKKRRLTVIEDLPAEKLRADGYERADRSAWGTCANGETLAELVSERELVLARDESGRVVRMVSRETVGRLRDEYGKRCRDEAEAEMEDDDADGEGTSPEERRAALEEKARLRRLEIDQESLARSYRPAFVAQLERAATARPEDLLRAVIGELITTPRLPLLRRGVIEPGESYRAEVPQLQAWAETASAEELALLLVESVALDGYEVAIATEEGTIEVRLVDEDAEEGGEA